MANEYLKRTPTSTGNRRVFTISLWAKLNDNSIANSPCDTFTNGSNFLTIRIGGSGSQAALVYQVDSGVTDYSRYWNLSERDFSAWSHHLFVFNSPAVDAGDRLSYYINGIKITNYSDTYGTFPQNFDFKIDTTRAFEIFRSGDTNLYGKGELCDYFFIDGQALTPDVFGFYKVGKGYVSAGSTQSTDFRPGQWVPKTPRVIKTAINNNGGFGVNGFYLPMNDSNNFGADFHCEPNSIIKLQENLPQPRSRIDGVGDYTGALRDDPFKQYLVLALPFVSGGLQSGFGDYSAAIKGSGSAVSLTNAGVSIASTASYYGSAAFFNNANNAGTTKLTGDSSAVNFGSGDWTVEGWIFPTQIYNYLTFITTRPDNGGYVDGWYVGCDANGTLAVYSNAYDVQTANGTIKTNQWTHFAAVRKSNNLTLYVNGVAVGINTNYTKTPTRTLFGIGQFPTGNTEAFPGYLQDLRIYKGVAKYKGGFDVPRPYTPVGIATWRAVPDSPANNFATWNPLDRARNTGTQTDGNLSTATNTGNYAIRSTVGVSTGKWYWEFCPTAATITNHHGIVAIGRSMGAFYLGETLDSWGMYDNNGNKRNNGSFDSYGTGFSQYDVGMVALDKGNGKIWWGKNGTWFASGNPSNATNEAFSNINIVCSGIGTDSFVSPSQLQYNSCSYNFGQNPTFSGNTTAGTYTDSNNKGLFKYQPPSGFLALCEDNLPTPAISDPGKHFKTVLYTGDGGSRNIVGVGFTPDLVWIKRRDVSTGDHKLVDSVRGAGFVLETNTTDIEGNETNNFTSFANDGFNLGANNATAWNESANYVAWCWKAGAGTTSTNTNGSITSVVSVNQDAGFSIVSYTGNETIGATVGHGLNKTVKFMITKSRNTTDNWVVHTNVTGTQTFSFLNLTNGGTTDSVAAPTSSVFYRGSANTINGSGLPYIAYCWAEIEGFSKFGSYTGNGSADGPFIYTGGRPAFVMIKRTDSTQNWPIIDSSRDSVNVANRRLFANLSDIEDQGIPNFVDILSNGFKCRDSNVSYNASGGTYIFACWMESPFTTANSK